MTNPDLLREHNQLLMARMAYACRDSFYTFVRYFWDTIVPDEPVWNWHIKLLCDEAQVVAIWVIKREKSLYDLLVNVPPGSTKTTIFTIFLPVWVWLNSASTRIISCSYAAGLSMEHAVKSRDVVRSLKFKELYPNTIFLKADQDNKAYYANTNNGSRAACSVGGAITGRHAHLILVDDPINPEEAESETKRDTALEYLDKTLSQRKTDRESTPTIMIMQRLNLGDPTGHWIEKAEKQGKAVRHIVLPADDSLGNIKPPELRKYYKKVDDWEHAMLDPIRIGPEALRNAQIDLGSRGFSGQMLQSPVATGGNIIKQDWIGYFDELPSQRPKSIIQSWDMAFKGGKDNAYNVCQTWFEYENGYYLVDVFREQMDFPQAKSMVVAKDSEFDAQKVLVEDKANGTPIMQELKIQTKINFVAIVPKGDKIERAHSCSPTFESGNVYIKRNEPWTAAYVEEITTFPNSKFADQMDTTSQYINYMRGKKRSGVTSIKGGRRSSITRGF